MVGYWFAEQCCCKVYLWLSHSLGTRAFGNAQIVRPAHFPLKHDDILLEESLKAYEAITQTILDLPAEFPGDSVIDKKHGLLDNVEEILMDKMTRKAL